ncbi:1-acyl-sn-glycerol-3-phosphate acyltransferase [Aureispira sp. CCB-QB1]|uniref:1-acyl-sn-glycerol-3-phosphate acyltransferase n=1 Tax=Aureispira sp. CCB-QB1 TaxID=1313421 RepID=UPI0006968C9C|nr:1-acyl-sn-glycerol-3-phosphate acyltransferase [Aureispira sp. CCB-QB1]
MKKIIGKIVIKILGWKIDPNTPKELFEKCVVIAAPHTSNWDYPIAVYSMAALGVNLRYTIKKDWMKFPYGGFFKLMGGIGVDRSIPNNRHQRMNLVSAIANLFKKHDQLAVIVQAEGTRALQKKWKTGFYYIALEANVPIALGYLDYQKKVSGIGKMIYPTGDIHRDMSEIMDFYKNITPKFSDKFALDERYSGSK